MAFNLETIHRALASQIQTYLKAHGRDTNVNPFLSGILSPPSITVEPDPSGYIPSYFETFGPAGYADINVRLKLEVDAIETESVGIKITDFLSVGTNNGSSIADAIRSDRTLGGVVDDCIPYQVDWSADEFWTAYVYVNQLDLSGVTNKVDFGTLSKVMQPCTTFNDGAYVCVKPGLISGAATVSGYQDYATGVLDDTINITTLGSQYPITVIPNPTGTVTAADPCWISRGLLGSENPLEGAKGDMAGFEMMFPYDTAIVQSKVAAPLAAVTTTGNGTAVAMAGPTAAQKLYCALHVTAYSGFTNVVFTVESDDNSGFTTPTVRLTFTTVTSLATGPQFISVAGNFSTETHHRIVRTVSGAGSITFAAAFGVI